LRRRRRGLDSADTVPWHGAMAQAFAECEAYPRNDIETWLNVVNAAGIGAKKLSDSACRRGRMP